MQNLSLKELSEGLKQKKFSSEELTKFFLNRLDLHNSSINAFITIDKDKSLAMAKRADEIIKEGNQDYLTGIPIAQKDIFCAEGWKTSCGSKMLDNFIAPYDSTVISKFNEAGCLIEPPVSVAVAAGANIPATAAALPPELPPGTVFISHGFLTLP